MSVHRRHQLTDKEARAVIRDLQKILPTLYPVRFQRSKRLLDNKRWGDCGKITRRGRQYLLIRIADWLPWPADYILLIHEYGHARTWKHDKLEAHEKNDHGPEWGIHHAETWRRSP